MLSDGNLTHLFQQGLNPSFLGFSGAGLPQHFNPQGAFAPLGAYGGVGHLGAFGPAFGQGFGQSPAFGQYGVGYPGFAQHELGQQQNPAQQILGVLTQLAQQAVMQGIATQQIGAVLHQLVQQIHFIQQVAAQSLQRGLAQGMGGQWPGQGFQPPQFGQGLSGWSGIQSQQYPFAQGFFGQGIGQSVGHGSGGYRPTMQ